MINLAGAEKVELNVAYPTFQVKFEGLERSVTAEKQPKNFRADTRQIKEIQIFLTKNRFYKGEVSGKLNRDTRNSLRKFQKAENIKITGTINSETFEKINQFPTTEIQPNLFDNAAIEVPINIIDNGELSTATNFVSRNYRFVAAKNNTTSFFLDGKSDYLAIAALFLLFSMALIAAFLFN